MVCHLYLGLVKGLYQGGLVKKGVCHLYTGLAYGGLVKKGVCHLYSGLALVLWSGLGRPGQEGAMSLVP